MDLVLGFDPGGDGQFGWAVLEHSRAGLPRSRATGAAAHAAAALKSALAHVASGDRVIGAGIDSPMYWTETGERAADIRVRGAILLRGAPAAGGTVQHPNSLRGACVVQGPTVALLLRRILPDAPITEAHPKAMLWLLGRARTDRPTKDVTTAELSDLFECDALSCEHERDAVLGAFAALGMIEKPAGWVDLVRDETDPIFVAGPVGYWLPLPAV